MLAVAICGGEKSPSGNSSIAESGGILSAIVGSIKRRFDPRSESSFLKWGSPVVVKVDSHPESRRVFVVQSEDDVQQLQHTEKTFEYSKSIMSTIVLQTPMSERLVDEIPLAKDEMKDVLIMAIIVFMQIMHLVNKEESSSWDNSEVRSRIALAMSISISVKYVMDAQPFGPMYTLSCLLKPGEAHCTEIQLREWIQDYEDIVLKKVSLYRCYFNHKMWAHEVLVDMLSEKRVSSLVATSAEELLLFFSFHVSQWLPEYCSIGECYIGPALVLLSLECLNVSGFAATENKPYGDQQSYRMASKMASDVSSKDTTRMQKMLNAPFTDNASWQRRATTQCNIKKAKMELDKRAASMARAAPYR